VRDQANTQEDLKQEVSGEGLLEAAVSVVTQPVATLRMVTQQQKLGWAIIVAVVVSLASSLTSVASLTPSELAGGANFSLPVDPTTFRVLTLAGGVVLGPLIGIIGLAVVAGIFQLVSMILGGKGAYVGLFCGLAFASVPSIIGTPFNLLPLAFGVAGEVLSGLVSFVLFIWTAVLTVIAIRENHQFSTGRALAVFLIPVAAIGLLVVVLGILLFAFLITAVAGV
jgi:hypothetical protein